VSVASVERANPRRAIPDRVRLVGGAHTALGRLPDTTPIELQAEAAHGALADAGLSPSDVDAVICQSPFTRALFFNAESLAEYIGAQPAITHTLAGGAVGTSMITSASAWIASGLARVVLCVYGETAATASRGVRGLAMAAGEAMEEFEKVYAANAPPIQYALLARRYLDRYGYTEDALGAVAIADSEHAALNPAATRRAPISLDAYRAARPIADPLKVLDCALISDGGCAFVLADRSVAREADQAEVAVLGLGGASTHWQLAQAPDLDDLGIERSARLAYEMAGVGPDDIDVAQLYDCFTIAVLLQLEGLGFCGPGEGGHYALAGKLRLGSERPVNTYGGLLSCAHLADTLAIVEGLHQLRGTAGPRQVPDARVALVTGIAGWVSTHRTLILGRL
jgi:acetyl-CoA acetyltransferase